MPDIFDYCDSRLYLKDYYDERKRNQPSFSYQYFANKAELKSKSFAYRLITGQKKLSKSTVFAVARAIGLNKHETEYFEAMVNLTQAKSPMEREFYFNHLQSYGKAHPAVQLRQHQFEYYSRWYLSALREVVVYFDFRNDYKVLSRMLDPPITTSQAKNGVSASSLLLTLSNNSPRGATGRPKHQLPWEIQSDPLQFRLIRKKAFASRRNHSPGIIDTTVIYQPSPWVLPKKDSCAYARKQRHSDSV